MMAKDLPDIAALRILELGASNYFKHEYPERTTQLWTGTRLPDHRCSTAWQRPGR